MRMPEVGKGKEELYGPRSGVATPASSNEGCSIERESNYSRIEPDKMQDRRGEEVLPLCLCCPFEDQEERAPGIMSERIITYGRRLSATKRQSCIKGKRAEDISPSCQ